MSRLTNQIGLLQCSFVLGVICLSGCGVSENDVRTARQNVAEEQRETNEVRREGQAEIRDKQRELDEARHKAMRPGYDENIQEEVADKQQELADKKREVNDDVREEERETQEAKRKAEEMERKLAATKERDAYVDKIDSKIESVDEQIDAMQKRLDGMDAESAAYQKLETDIEVLQVQRENLSDALSELKNAEVLEWESRKVLVEKALERIESGKDDK